MKNRRNYIFVAGIIIVIAVIMCLAFTGKDAKYTNKYVPGITNNSDNSHVTIIADKDNVTPLVTPTIFPTVSPVPTVTVSSNQTPLEVHGRLSVKGSQLVDKNGSGFQLKGVSTHGLQWFPQYVNKEAFKSLRDEWGCNVVRLALYTHENGYCSGGNKTTLKKLVTDGVEYATELGLYVVIDWHVLNEQNPDTYKSEAITFFNEMSKKYASYDNVIYEICNEPNGSTTWNQIKTYASDVISTIRANDKDAVIIVGTPTWSQDVDKAAASQISGYSNIMYALHFYADTHTDWLRTRMVNAVNSGLPIFVSEFGICDASGNGNCNISQANEWVKTMDDYGISYICWNLANKNESSSLISSGSNKTSGWKYDELSIQGKWLVDTLRGSIANNSSNYVSKSAPTSTPKADVSTPTPTPSKNTSDKGSATADLISSWSDGSEYWCQYDITINSNSSKVNNWTITVTFSDKITGVSGWNAEYSVDNNRVIIKPTEEWTKNIAAGTTVTGLGFMVSGNSQISIISTEISY